MDADNKMNKLRVLCQQRLIESGEKERLMGFLSGRLLESGYNEEVIQFCKNYIRSKGVEHIDLESLISGVTPNARQAVPDQVKREMLKKIREFINNEMYKNESLLHP